MPTSQWEGKGCGYARWGRGVAMQGRGGCVAMQGRGGVWLCKVGEGCGYAK